MNSKRGGLLGGTIVMFVAVIAIVIILAVFVLLSGVVKLVEKADGGLKIEEGEDVGLANLVSYMAVDYHRLVDVRVSVHKGDSVAQSLEEAKYYER